MDGDSLYPPDVVGALDPIAAAVQGQQGLTQVPTNGARRSPTFGGLASLNQYINDRFTPDNQKALKDKVDTSQGNLADILNNPETDPRAKWFSLASAIGRPTKSGRFAEAASNGLDALNNAESQELQMRQQYKLALLEMVQKRAQQQYDKERDAELSARERAAQLDMTSTLAVAKPGAGFAPVYKNVSGRLVRVDPIDNSVNILTDDQSDEYNKALLFYAKEGQDKLQLKTAAQIDEYAKSMASKAMEDAAKYRTPSINASPDTSVQLDQLNKMRADGVSRNDNNWVREIDRRISTLRAQQAPAPDATGAPAPSSAAATGTPEIRSLIVDAAKKYGIPPAVGLSLARVESGFNPNATGPKTAHGNGRGVYQIVDGFRGDYNVTDPYNAAQNIDGALGKLRANIDATGSLELGLAAHHAGLGAVQKAGGIPNTNDGQMSTSDFVRAVMDGAGGAPAPAAALHRPPSGTKIAGADIMLRQPETEKADEIRGAESENYYYKKVMPEAETANARLNSNNVFLDGLKSGKIKPGKLSDWQTQLGAWANAFGIDMGVVKQADANQTFTPLIEQTVNKILMDAAGVQTDSDAKRARNQIASMQQTPAAMEATLRYGNALELKKIERARFFTKWQKDNHGYSMGAQQAWMESPWYDAPAMVSTPKGKFAYWNDYVAQFKKAYPDATDTEAVESWNHVAKGGK